MASSREVRTTWHKERRKSKRGAPVAMSVARSPDPQGVGNRCLDSSFSIKRPRPETAALHSHPKPRSPRLSRSIHISLLPAWATGPLVWAAVGPSPVLLSYAKWRLWDRLFSWSSSVLARQGRPCDDLVRRRHRRCPAGPSRWSLRDGVVPLRAGLLDLRYCQLRCDWSLMLRR